MGGKECFTPITAVILNCLIVQVLAVLGNHNGLIQIVCSIHFFLCVQPYTFPPLTSAAGYRISYNDGSSTSVVDVDYSRTQYTIRGLQSNVSYTVRIRAQFHFSEYCITTRFNRLHGHLVSLPPLWTHVGILQPRVQYS